MVLIHSIARASSWMFQVEFHSYLRVSKLRVYNEMKVSRVCNQGIPDEGKPSLQLDGPLEADD